MKYDLDTINSKLAALARLDRRVTVFVTVSSYSQHMEVMSRRGTERNGMWCLLWDCRRLILEGADLLAEAA
jgi:hypothetical protein